MAEVSGVTIHRRERLLAVLVGVAWGLSIICIVANIIGSNTGAIGDNAFLPLWQVVAVLPLIGLPLGMLVMIALVVVSTVRRSREAKDA